MTAPRDCIGSYEITAKLGEGGMGEVWRATDTKLDRQVAIKVLPAEFTADPERLARFEREAKLLAQLHHPNIASIFGMEESHGTKALVMELVEGPTLAERLESGALPFNECLSIALQIAHALEEAHEKGIIHRDLKPQNIKASVEGKVKVLDFGLAKAMDPTGAASGTASASQLAKSPTLTMGATVQGMILGTAAYMAPEQAAGAMVDRRADIWSFGVVLYEMLVGRRLFDGETVSHVLAGVLKDEPDFSLLPADTPPRIRRLVARCLRKRPRERLQAIGDARIVIDEVLDGTPEEAAAGAAAPAATASLRSGPMRVALAALTLSTLALAAYVVLDRPVATKIVRASILPPPNVHFHLDPRNPGPIALSPDGRQLAFAGASAAGRSLWVRAVDSLVARELPGTEGAFYPFWSPDSQQVGFFTETHLKKIAVAGGPPVALVKAGNCKGGSWSPRGVIIFAPGSGSALVSVSAAGGETKKLTELDTAKGDVSHRHPRFLPDGEHFLYVVRLAGNVHELRVGALDGSPPVVLVDTPANAEYSSGKLLFVRDSTLMAQPFDVTSRRLEGEAVPLVEDVMRIPAAEVAVFTVSAEGTLAYQAGTSVSEKRLAWRDREGKELGRLGEPADQLHPRISPDGRSVAVDINDPDGTNQDIWIFDVGRGLRSRFTFDPATDRSAIWSPDSQNLLFSSARGDARAYAVWIAPVGGTGAPQQLASAPPRSLYGNSWSPDGERILAVATGGGASVDLMVIPATGDEPMPFVVSDFNEGNGAISPDGRWVAYQSNESGQYEIYVTSFPAPGRKWQVSENNGFMPAWRADGRELFFRDDQNLYAAEVDGSGALFEVGAVKQLFALPPQFDVERQYDVTRDGKRFLVNEPIGTTDDSPVTLVLHWDAELPKS